MLQLPKPVQLLPKPSPDQFSLNTTFDTNSSQWQEMITRAVQPITRKRITDPGWQCDSSLTNCSTKQTAIKECLSTVQKMVLPESRTENFSFRLNVVSAGLSPAEATSRNHQPPHSSADPTAACRSQATVSLRKQFEQLPENQWALLSAAPPAMALHPG